MRKYQLGEGQALTVAFALDQKNYDRLDKYVKTSGMTKSEFLRDMLIATLDDIENGIDKTNKMEAIK